MKKTILYIATAATLAAVSVIAVIGCNDGGANAGRVSEEVNAFLNKFDNAVPAATVTPPTPGRFTVYFNSNGGRNNPPDREEKDSGAEIILPDQRTMEKDGHSFWGWNTKIDGTGDGYPANSPYTVTQSITLYAVWTPKTYTLTLKISPEGSGSVSIEPDKEIYVFDDAVTVTATPSSAEYEFTGWSDASLPNDNPVTITMDRDKTLTARFRRVDAPQFTITFNSNGGGNNPPEKTKEYSGTEITLPDRQTMQKDGYSFGGWNTKDDGTGDGLPAYSPYTVTQSITLYAVWTLVNYTITFNANGGTVSPTSGTTGDGWMLSSLPVPTNTGYRFDGWFTAQTGGYMVTESTVFSANTLVYARWTAINYTITFEANGGTVSPTFGVTVDGGKLSSLPVPATRTGYTFNGWFTTSAATGGTQVTTSYAFSAHTTIYARWTAINYSITYTIGDGSVTSANPTSYTIETSFTLNNPTSTRTCYKFAGWTGSNGSSRQTSVSVSRGNTGALSYVANWDHLTYTLTTNVSPVGGGTVLRNPNQTTPYNCGESVNLTATAGDGYTFKNWSGASTSASASISVAMGSDVTLTANFTSTGTPPVGGYGTFTDSRNSKTYKTVTIGNQRWMAENLNYDTADGTGSWCYGNSQDSCTKYGRLYNWNTAMAGASSSMANPSGVRGVCPSGWHLPSSAEWTALVNEVGSLSGTKLKSTSGWNDYNGASGNGTDAYGFSALPGGNRYSGGDFYDVGTTASGGRPRSTVRTTPTAGA